MTGDSQTAVHALNHRYLQQHPYTAARRLEDLKPEAAGEVLSTLPPAVAIPVIEKLSPSFAAILLPALESSLIKQWMETGDTKTVVAVLHQLEARQVDDLLNQARPAVKQEIRTLMAYPANTAGSMMDPRVEPLMETMTVDQVLRRFRQPGHKAKPALFIQNEARALTGYVSLQALLSADPGFLLRDIKRPVAAAVEPVTPKEEVVELFEKYRFNNVPVVGINGELLGVIWQDALMQATEEEVTSDIQAMVGASREERALSKTNFAVRKRQPWLQINLVTAFLAASVVGLFEDMIARFTALAVLLPVVAGQSGNTGAQALAVTMRALAVREITIRHWGRVLWKECRAGFLNGVGVCVTTCLGVYLWSHSTGLTLVIGISMILSMIIAGVAGAAVPIVLVRLGQDPATASSIILTTVTDVMGFFSFLGTATLLSRLL